MVSVQQTLSDATKLLEQSGNNSARLDATLLLAHTLNTTRENIIINHNDNIDSAARNAFNVLLKRRLHHEPMAYIIGKKEFWSLDFFVSRDTLIPRPDSETLIEAALSCVKDRAQPVSIVDIGTGTGCLLITLLREFPNATGTGIDNNKQAISVAEKNSAYHGVANRAKFIESHWLNELHDPVDLIVANPPYITEKELAALMQDVKDYEPIGALFGGNDGLDSYRALAPLMPAYLNHGGYAVFEVGAGQAPEVADLLSDAGMQTISRVKDLAGTERCVVAQYI